MHRPAHARTVAHATGGAIGSLLLAAVLVACSGTAANQTPPTGSPRGETHPSTPSAPATGTPNPTRSPASTPGPTATPPLPGSLPVRGRMVGQAPIGFALVTPSALIGLGGPPAVMERHDPVTFGDLGDVEFGSKAGAFPPDGQSVAPGTGGVWYTLAAQRAVALVDPATGKILRRLEVDAYPYNVVEHEGDLWIADFERGKVLRVDLATGTTVATIPVRDPTGITVGEGFVWATSHVGRHDEGEPIEGNGGYLAKIDPVTNERVALVEVGPRPYWVVAAFGSAWTGNATGGSVSRVDAVTNEVTTIPVGADGAFDIEVVGDAIWVGVGPQYWAPDCDPTAAVVTGGVVRIDPATNQVDARVDVPCAGGIVPDGDRMWISPAAGGGSVLIDPAG